MTPTFLSMDHFLYRYFMFSKKMKKIYRLEVFGKYTIFLALRRSSSHCSCSVQRFQRPLERSRFVKMLAIFGIIIWQGSLEVNQSVLIGSFLVGISPYEPFPWNGHNLCIFFCFRKPANSKQA